MIKEYGPPSVCPKESKGLQKHWDQIVHKGQQNNEFQVVRKKIIDILTGSSR